MNLKETSSLLGWKRENVVIAILEGIETPTKKVVIKLTATKQDADYDIKEDDIDNFLAAFESDTLGRYPSVDIRRELLIESGYQCAICKSDSPLQFHHIVDWSKLKHHDPAQMLAVCANCHSKIGLGIIDTIAQKTIKQQLTHRSHKSLVTDARTPTNLAYFPKAERAEQSTPEDVASEFLEEMGLKDDEFVVVNPFITSPEAWFHERFTEAFPGIRGVEEISDSSQAVDRLSILLRLPLKWAWRTKEDGFSATSPIWWWRGLGNMSIEHYSVVAPNEILMNNQELPIRRIVAVNVGAYWQSFVYVETIPKSPIGIYEKDSDSDSRMLGFSGYLYEEYGLFQNRAVTRAEYDDGAAIIDGKPQKIPETQLRIRFLTPYNFVIASQGSPINNSKADLKLNKILIEILQQKCSIHDLVSEVLSLPRRGDFDGY